MKVLQIADRVFVKKEQKWRTVMTGKDVI